MRLGTAPGWHRKKWKEKRAELIKKKGCCEWCGKCEHHQKVDQQLYCKLHPSKECPNSMFIEESIIRRFYELPLHDY